MWRKFLAAFVALTISVGAIFAEEIKGVFVKYADGKVIIKGADGKEKELSVDEKAVMKVGEKEFPLRTWFEQTKSLAAGKSKLALTVEKDAVTGVKTDTGGKTPPKTKPKP